MSDLIESFKKHWAIQILGICTVVAVSSWALSLVLIEHPLRDKLEIAEQHTAMLRDQSAGLRDQLSGLKNQVSLLTRQQPLAGATQNSPPSQPADAKSDPGFASGACLALDEGNKLYTQAKYTEAIERYLTAQAVDKLGKSACVGSIYATVGTIYALVAAPQMATNSAEAAKNYRLASEYNRAFAVAAICNRGECKLAEDFWANISAATR